MKAEFNMMRLLILKMEGGPSQRVGAAPKLGKARKQILP